MTKKKGWKFIRKDDPDPKHEAALELAQQYKPSIMFVTVKIDTEADALYVYLGANPTDGVNSTSTETIRHSRPTINLDKDSDGRVLGMEIIGPFDPMPVLTGPYGSGKTMPTPMNLNEAVFFAIQGLGPVMPEDFDSDGIGGDFIQLLAAYGYRVVSI